MPGRIDGTPVPEGPQRTRQNEQRRSQNTTDTSKTSGTDDSVELSDVATLQSAAREVPDVREDRVAQARARIAAGEYDNENTRRIIAERILDQFGLE